MFKVLNVDTVKIIGFCLFVFFMGFGFVNLTSISLILLTLVSIYSFWKIRVDLKEDDKKIILLFSIFYLITVVYSVVFLEFVYIERQISFVVFPVLCLYFNRDLLQNSLVRKKIIFFFSLGLLLYPIFIISYYWFLKIPTETGFAVDVTSLYQLKRIVFSTNIFDFRFHNVYYSGYSLCAILFICYEYKIRNNKYLLALILLHTFFIYLSASRISYFLIILLLAYYILSVNISKLKKTLLLFSLLFCFYFLIQSYPYLYHKFVKTLPLAFENRIIIWSNALEVFLNNIFGNGYVNFHEKLYQKNKLLVISPKVNAHNQYLEYFGAIGFIGGSYFIYVMLYFIKKAFIKKNKILLIFILVMLVSFFTESWLYRHKGIVFFMFFITFLWNKKD
jgi:hypothetical protein